MTLDDAPSLTTWPSQKRMQRGQRPFTAAMLWLTNSTVRPPLGHVAHLAEALLLELGVADRQHLVDDQDFRLQVRGHGERQPHVHAAGIVLDRRVEELLDLGEGDDLVELAVGSRRGVMPRIAPLR